MAVSTGLPQKKKAPGKVHKRKQKQIKKAKGNNSEAPVDLSIYMKKRDFATDLNEYIELWRGRESGSGWKFNKVLQSWAVTHALDKKLIDKELFNLLCPYLVTIAGVQRDRFLSFIDDVIEKGDDESTAVREDGPVAAAPASKPSYKRAVKLRKIMT